MNGKKYPRNFERVNSDMSRIKTPFGWYVLIHAQIISGGKDIHVSQSLYRYDDPDYEWELQDK